MAGMVSEIRARRLERLADARLYLCTDSRREKGDLDEFLDAVLSGGVDIVQLREKGLEAAEELALLETFATACRRHGALLAVNDRADIAFAAGSDVLHLGQRDLPPATARELLGPDVLLGRSCHGAEQVAGALADAELDYHCIGPVWPTPTKAGRPAVGLAAVDTASHLADGSGGRSTPGGARPWFAIGGVDEERLDEVLRAGARRVVVVRALTAAATPAAAHEAAARLSARLR